MKKAGRGVTSKSSTRRKEASSSTSSSSSVKDQKDNDRSFQKHLKQIVSYRNKRGDILMPVDSSTRKLRRWISRQKKKHSEESLPFSQVVELESLGITFKKNSSSSSSSLSGGGISSKKKKHISKVVQKKKPLRAKKSFPVRLKELKALNKRQGNLKKNTSLYQWTIEQTERYQEGNMTSAEERQLKSAGLKLGSAKKTKQTSSSNSSRARASLSSMDDDFDTVFKTLKAFQNKHGHCNVPKRKNAALYKWITVQKTRNSKNDLSRHEVGQLQSIGLLLDSKSKKRSIIDQASPPSSKIKSRGRKSRVPFKDRVAELALYKKEHGHLNVHWRNDGIYKWFMKIKLDWERGTLNRDERRQLEEIDFENAISKKRPIKINRRRIEKKVEEEDEMEEKEEDEMEDEYEKEDADDEFVSQDFLDSLKNLVHIRDLGKRSTFPESYKQQVYEWAQKQRERHAEGKLTKAEKRKLAGAGFVFSSQAISDRNQEIDSDDDNTDAGKEVGTNDDYEGVNTEKSDFLTNLQKLETFKETYGNLKVDEKKHKFLHNWMVEQKKRYKIGTLLRSEEKDLRKIGLIIGPPLSVFPSNFKKLEDFVRDNGHCKLNSSDSPALYGWLNKQIYKRKSGKMAKEDEELLGELGVFDEEESDGNSEGADMKTHHEIKVNKVSKFKENAVTQDHTEANMQRNASFEDETDNESALVCHKRANGQSSANVSSSHETSIVPVVEKGANSSNLLMRLNYLYEMTGHHPNPQDGLLQRLQFLERTFFGNQSEVKGLFINRVRLLEKELLSPPEELCIEYGKGI